MGKGLEALLAHELHHVYLIGYLSRLNDLDEADPNFPLVWSIDKLRLEGVADLIDTLMSPEGTGPPGHDQSGWSSLGPGPATAGTGSTSVSRRLWQSAGQIVPAASP